MVDRSQREGEAAAPAPGDGAAVTGGGAAAFDTPPPQREWTAARFIAVWFLLPAAIFLGVLVVYPLVYTFIRSLFNASGSKFVGGGNYVDMFTSGSTQTALKNNAIWVVVAPTIVTALGLIFAVLSERIKWSTAFKVILFMPMAISFTAIGIIFRLVYQADPDQGLANAMAVSIHDIFSSQSAYPTAFPRDRDGVPKLPDGAYQTQKQYAAGSAATLPLVGVKPTDVPSGAKLAQAAKPAATDAITGTVWLDFTPGGGGKSGAIDPNEKGLPGLKVQAVQGGKVVGSDSTDSHGDFTISGLDKGQHYQLRLAASNFAQPFAGITWLGPSLVTPSIIGSYVWMWAGFAMVLIGAGLAAIPRDALEAARVDGANEWQVFRRVTVPLLAPVLTVVFVTLVINVLKIFDLVLILAPQSSQPDANVLALEMWRVSFGGGQNQGLGSALAIFLFILVIPAMLFNIRRFKREA